MTSWKVRMALTLDMHKRTDGLFSHYQFLEIVSEICLLDFSDLLYMLHDLNANRGLYVNEC